LLGVGSIALVYLAARWLGASRRAASLGATIASVVPHSAWLGVAMVPELPVAACTLLGMAGASSREPYRVLAGGVALFIATLGRYEAWPVAAVFSALVLVDAIRTRSGWRALAAATASLGMAAWILHGVFVHGDALFFLHRVASYRAALAGDGGSALVRLLRPLFALIVAEPELTVAFAVGVLVSKSLPGASPRPPAAWQRAALMATTLAAFLCVGAAIGGEATHHPQRPLLTVWLFAAVAGAVGLARPWTDVRALVTPRRVLVTAAIAGSLIAVSRLHFPRDSFAPRVDERAVGAAARTLVPAGERLFVDTPDYGYFAVMAAFGDPSRTVVLRKHDPRSPDPSEAVAWQAARQLGVRFAVVDRSAPDTPRAAELRAAGQLALVRVEEPPHP
jgi:hypothetical protein